MKKRLLYLSYYFEPDFGAGSFRNSSIVRNLQNKLRVDEEVYVIVSTPNRYQGTKLHAPDFEDRGNVKIFRVSVPQHHNGFLRQIFSFLFYAWGVFRLVRNWKMDMVFASSSKLMTAYLAYTIARRNKAILFLDIRDLFAENLLEMIRWKLPGWISFNFIRKFFEIPCFRYASNINVNSEGFIQSLDYLKNTKISFYPNGIDDFFVGHSPSASIESRPITICYAGNIGEAQGLEKIIPSLALRLGSDYLFKIIGDGSAKIKLRKRLKALHVTNVQLIDPVPRINLLEYYTHSHFLFIHLNNYRTLEKVLPSKLFEYACFQIPIIAGVAGYAKEFMEKYVKANVFIFDPCDVEAAINLFKNVEYRLLERPDFIRAFDRNRISGELTDLILKEFRKV
ncbi:MAG: glycosyltransferase family 4 protein [Saprospiraceae bacterium]|nr:glycosyltransferase family 4 protein [Saprospiraceae bacterium]